MILYISGIGINVDPALWAKLEGPKPPDGFECNGCGPQGHWFVSWLVPDRVAGICVAPACAIHDYSCALAGNRSDFADASAELGRNVEHILRAGDFQRLARLVGFFMLVNASMLVAWGYYLTGNRRAKDIMFDFAEGAKRHWTPGGAAMDWRMASTAWMPPWSSVLPPMASFQIQRHWLV